ncbi:MAG TPA: hypothetical protein HPP77_04030 [Candidatus Hydrogenedentes bacterium]|nr:hypothetical protein [Candidatus Hydrogenedentota bacterium]
MPKFTGGGNVTHTYAGPDLEIGMYYQFRVFSFHEDLSGRTPISATEDLRGVFFYLGNESPAP